MPADCKITMHQFKSMSHADLVNITKAYISHLGGQSPFLSSIAQNLWSMCYQAQILLIAVHQPKKVNVQADRLLRRKHDHTDIQVNLKVFNMVNQRYGPH